MLRLGLNMVNNPDLLIVLILIFAGILFWILIHYGLKSRQNTIARWLQETNASFVQTKLPDQEMHWLSLLYGNFYDASADVVACDIKNQHDAVVGRVAYATVGITLETDDGSFRISHENGSWRVIAHRVQAGASTYQMAVCTCSGLIRKRCLFAFAEGSRVEMQFRIFGRRAVIIRDDVRIGEWFRLGPYELSGKALVLTEELPLYQQIVLLAAPFSRKQHVSY